MARMNISIPDALHEQMQAFKDQNWSQIAARAFETVIELERVKNVDTDEASIARLRASREKAEDHREADGVAAGKQWALHRAEYDQLERVARVDGEMLDQWYDRPNGHQGAATLLAQMILDDQAPSWQEVTEEMEALFRRTDPTIAEIRGFFQGACDVYDQV